MGQVNRKVPKITLRFHFLSILRFSHKTYNFARMPNKPNLKTDLKLAIPEVSF